MGSTTRPAKLGCTCDVGLTSRLSPEIKRVQAMVSKSSNYVRAILRIGICQKPCTSFATCICPVAIGKAKDSIPLIRVGCYIWRLHPRVPWSCLFILGSAWKNNGVHRTTKSLGCLEVVTQEELRAISIKRSIQSCVLDDIAGGIESIDQIQLCEKPKERRGLNRASDHAVGQTKRVVQGLQLM